MRQFVINFFVTKNGGGNKAAVVFADIEISEQQMQKIAKKQFF